MRDDQGSRSILILTATYGEGHLRAAQALAHAVGRLEPQRPVHVVDFFERVSPVTNRVVRRLYVGSVRRVPRLYGQWYEATRAIPEGSLVQRAMDHYHTHGMWRILHQTRPACVVSTFPIPAGVLSTLRREQGLTVPSVAVVTDFVVHSQWIHSGIDLYAVAHEDLREGMVQRGVPRERILVTGIPIDPRFGDVTIHRPAGPPWQVLVMGGAYGMLPRTLRLVKGLMSLEGIHVVLVAGRDQQLYARGQALAQGAGGRLRVLGYTTQVPELMATSHLLVTKAGGLTVSEALAMHLPLLIFRPLPGQERANVDFLVRHGAARVFYDTPSLLAEVRRLLQDPGSLAQEGSSAISLGRPHSALEVARHVLELARTAPELPAFAARERPWWRRRMLRPLLPGRLRPRRREALRP
jgi:processive 1,2-diacylglycerol beta-glucosyltransferase